MKIKEATRIKLELEYFIFGVMYILLFCIYMLIFGGFFAFVALLFYSNFIVGISVGVVMGIVMWIWVAHVCANAAVYLGH